MSIFSFKLAILIGMICLTAVGCARPTGNANVVPPAASNSANARADVPAPRVNDTYPQEVVNEFVKSCRTAGSSGKLCTCLIEKIQEKYSFEEFTVLELKLKSGAPPEEFIEFTGRAKAQCTRQVGS